MAQRINVPFKNLTAEPDKQTITYSILDRLNKCGTCLKLSHIINKKLRVTDSYNPNTHDWKSALKLMSERKIKVAKIIFRKVGIDEWEKAYKLIKSDESTKIIIHTIV